MDLRISLLVAVSAGLGSLRRRLSLPFVFSELQSQQRKFLGIK